MEEAGELGYYLPLSFKIPSARTYVAGAASGSRMKGLPVGLCGNALQYVAQLAGFCVALLALREQRYLLLELLFRQQLDRCRLIPVERVEPVVASQRREIQRCEHGLNFPQCVLPGIIPLVQPGQKLPSRLLVRGEVAPVIELRPVFGGRCDVPVHGKVHDHGELVFQPLPLHERQPDLGDLALFPVLLDDLIGGLGPERGDDVARTAENGIHQLVVLRASPRARR